jgi:RNA polymerase sigma-70 factor, ECF subfamily
MSDSPKQVVRNTGGGEGQAAIDIKLEIVTLMPNLRAFARSLCGNPTRADDLVQDCIVKALSNLHSFQPGTNLRAWLFIILRNTYYSDMRKKWREVEDADGDHAARLVELPTQNSVFEVEDFKQAFAKLGAEQREVLTLVAAMGLSYEEAAGICNCAVGTVKSRVSRGRAQLATLLGLAPGESLSDGESQNIPQGVIVGPW